MGHLGLTPQSVHAMGGYRVQGTRPRRREAAPRRRPRARGRRVLRARARGRARRPRRADHRAAHDPDDRHRRRALDRRPGARLPRPARARQPPAREVRPRVRPARARRSPRRSGASPTTCARALPRARGDLRGERRAPRARSATEPPARRRDAALGVRGDECAASSAFIWSTRLSAALATHSIPPCIVKPDGLSNWYGPFELHIIHGLAIAWSPRVELRDHRRASPFTLELETQVNVGVARTDAGCRQVRATSVAEERERRRRARRRCCPACSTTHRLVPSEAIADRATRRRMLALVALVTVRSRLPRDEGDRGHPVGRRRRGVVRCVDGRVAPRTASPVASVSRVADAGIERAERAPSPRCHSVIAPVEHASTTWPRRVDREEASWPGRHSRSSWSTPSRSIATPPPRAATASSATPAAEASDEGQSSAVLTVTVTIDDGAVTPELGVRHAAKERAAVRREDGEGARARFATTIHGPIDAIADGVANRRGGRGARGAAPVRRRRQSEPATSAAARPSGGVQQRASDHGAPLDGVDATVPSGLPRRTGSARGVGARMGAAWRRVASDARGAIDGRHRDGYHLPSRFGGTHTLPRATGPGALRRSRGRTGPCGPTRP